MSNLANALLKGKQVSMANGAQNKIDSYLAKLKEGLRWMKETEANEIVRELQSQITETARASGELSEAGIDAALAAVGSPEELAKEYRTDELLTRMEANRSPMRMLDGLFQWASLSAAGFFALLGSLAGYCFGLVCMLIAILKPFHPHTAGLWKFLDKTGDPDFSLRLGFGPAPPDGHELLGWWMVPIGLGVGFVCLLMTTSFARWCVRQFHRTPALPRSS
jgi:hypothetical protein